MNKYPLYRDIAGDPNYSFRACFFDLIGTVLLGIGFALLLYFAV